LRREPFDQILSQRQEGAKVNGPLVLRIGVSIGKADFRVVEIMRIKGIDPELAPDSVRAAFQKSIELFGRVITPNLVMAHRPEIFLASGRLNQAVAASTVVDGRLKTLAFVRTAQMIGCPF
jgi:hypothetical protein